MLFSSMVFIFVFLPIVAILYYISPRRFRNLILLVSSIIFYAWGEPVYVFIMLATILPHGQLLKQVSTTLTVSLAKYLEQEKAFLLMQTSTVLKQPCVWLIR